MKKYLKMISREACLLMYYGVKLAFGVLVIGILAYNYNRYNLQSVQYHAISIELVRTSFGLFVQFILGGIILDCVKAVQSRKIK